jgi:hypothetical protein
VAGSNQQMQELWLRAHERNATSVLLLVDSMSRLGAVQQQDMAASIGRLAAWLGQQLAADPAFDPTSDLQAFKAVRRDATRRTRFCVSALPHGGASIDGDGQVPRHVHGTLKTHVFTLPLRTVPPHPHTPRTQAFTGTSLAAKLAARRINTAALTTVLVDLGAAQPPPPHSNAWIAAPVVGSVVGAAVLVGAAALLLRARRQAAAAGAPGARADADADAGAGGAARAPADAGVRVRRAADKYALTQPAAAAAPSGGGSAQQQQQQQAEAAGSEAGTAAALPRASAALPAAAGSPAREQAAKGASDRK